MIQLSLFRGVHDTQPRPVTLEEVVTMMRTDQSVRDLTEKHRYARSVGDEQGASRYKKMMTSFGVAARFEGGRQQKHIVELTGLSLVDIDHIPAERMGEVLALVRGDEHTLLAYTTLSGQGLRILFRYTVNKTTDCPDYTDLLTDGSSTPNTNNLSNSRNLRLNKASIKTTDCSDYTDSSVDGSSTPRSNNPCHPRNLWLNNQEYRRVFEQGNEYYSNLLNLSYDEKCKNATRISGMAHDPEVYYNPDAVPIVVDMTKKPVGRPRRGKSEEVRVKRCEAAVLRELEQRGVVYEAGNHNKYISDACYMMNRYGVPENECLKWALDKFSDYQAEGNDVASIVRSCYLQTEEHSTARPPKAEKESRYASIKDIQEWLTERGVKIRHNVITRKREMAPLLSPQGGKTPTSHSVSSPLGGNEGGHLSFNDNDNVNDNCRPDGWSTSALSSTFSFWKELEDKSVNSLYCRFCLDTGRQAKISDFYIIIESDFYPEYHPLREYLESLPAWNGIDYIDQVASMVHVAGCTQEMHNRFFKQWLVAMVAAWLEPDKTNHEILTYIGPQGIYKSTFVRHLLPTELSGYFSTKNFAGRMSKDDRLELTEMALISLEELDSLQSAELNQLKAITTDPTVNERAAFARYKERRTHIASFCGTGNNPRFLTDLTDNRRWLPFLVRDIDSPWTHPMPYDGMYSQAYTLYRTGFRYWFDADDNAELQRHNRQFEEPCMEEELIATYLRVPYGDEVGEFLTATRIIELIGGAVKRPLSAKKVALCMNRLGFEARRIRNVRGWNVAILTGNDIKEHQRLNAHRSVED